MFEDSIADIRGAKDTDTTDLQLTNENWGIPSADFACRFSPTISERDIP